MIWSANYSNYKHLLCIAWHLKGLCSTVSIMSNDTDQSILLVKVLSVYYVTDVDAALCPHLLTLLLKCEMIAGKYRERTEDSRPNCSYCIFALHSNTAYGVYLTMTYLHDLTNFKWFYCLFSNLLQLHIMYRFRLPADTIRWIDVDSALVQRRRRWTDVKTCLSGYYISNRLVYYQ